jgi:hypothetical protein
MGRDQIERFSAQPSGPAHGGEAFGAVQLDLPGIGKGSNCSINISHKRQIPVTCGGVIGEDSLSINLQQKARASTAALWPDEALYRQTL